MQGQDLIFEAQITQTPLHYIVNSILPCTAVGINNRYLSDILHFVADVVHNQDTTSFMRTNKHAVRGSIPWYREIIMLILLRTCFSVGYANNVYNSDYPVEMVDAHVTQFLLTNTSLISFTTRYWTLENHHLLPDK